MTYPEVLANARTCIGQYCKACPVCNGVACKNQIPGPGAKGVGDTAIRNYNKWADIRVNMDTLCPGGAPDTTLELFGTEYPDGSHHRGKPAGHRAESGRSDGDHRSGDRRVGHLRRLHPH